MLKEWSCFLFDERRQEIIDIPLHFDTLLAPAEAIDECENNVAIWVTNFTSQQRLGRQEEANRQAVIRDLPSGAEMRRRYYIAFL